tara:strand:- start:743 stop:1006 length:264 start_codon:yes stop_codon:yes gene_type:complete
VLAIYNKGKSIQWVIDAIEKSKDREVPDKNYITDTSTDNADKSVKRCPDCDKGWEETFRNGRRLYLYYDCYVKLGKEKKVCPKCTKG